MIIINPDAATASTVARRIKISWISLLTVMNSYANMTGTGLITVYQKAMAVMSLASFSYKYRVRYPPHDSYTGGNHGF